MTFTQVHCSALQPAGSRPGKAGYFHLLAQMKVTKAKGLTRFEFGICLEDGAVDQELLGKPTEASKQMSDSNRVEALFLGDFFLGQQKEVTRLPGGTGALPRKAQARRQGEQSAQARRQGDQSAQARRQGEQPQATTGGHP